MTLPPDSHRGGVLTMASVLKVTANGTTTSPVLRGAWVLDRILGTPPPKPPADVAAVEPDIRGATTIREQLAKHRQRAACASCHAKIDPPGFALESFDVIGGWRDNYRSVGNGEPVVVNGRTMRYLKGPTVDAGRRAAGRPTVPEHRRVQATAAEGQGPAGPRPDREAADLRHGRHARRRPTSRRSRRSSRKIRDKNYGFRTLVHEIVQSKVFQSK